jgi:transposase
MDIRALARQGYSYAEIGRLVGRDWRTVKRYLEEGAQPVYRRKRMPSKLDALKPLIDQWLAAESRLLATRVHQDLVRDYGFDGSYNTVRRYVERARPKPARRSEERFETAPGFQAQVDWSHEQPIRTSSGLELPLYCFHMVLGHSRDAFCALTGSQDLVTFWSCHRQAFAHFGGVPRELLYDRTKTVSARATSPWDWRWKRSPAATWSATPPLTISSAACGKPTRSASSTTSSRSCSDRTSW